jgi:hypothetical protein
MQQKYMPTPPDLCIFSDAQPKKYLSGQPCEDGCGNAKNIRKIPQFSRYFSRFFRDFFEGYSLEIPPFSW